MFPNPTIESVTASLLQERQSKEAAYAQIDYLNKQAKQLNIETERVMADKLAEIKRLKEAIKIRNKHIDDCEKADTRSQRQHDESSKIYMDEVNRLKKALAVIHEIANNHIVDKPTHHTHWTFQQIWDLSLQEPK